MDTVVVVVGQLASIYICKFNNSKVRLRAYDAEKGANLLVKSLRDLNELYSEENSIHCHHLELCKTGV